MSEKEVFGKGKEQVLPSAIRFHKAALYELCAATFPSATFFHMHESNPHLAIGGPVIRLTAIRLQLTDPVNPSCGFAAIRFQKAAPYDFCAASFTPHSSLLTPH